MKNKTFSLTERQFDWLAGQAATCQTSESDILRRVLDDKIDTPDRQVVYLPPKHQEPPADHGGSTLIRVRRSTHARLSELSTRTGHSQVSILEKLLALPDDRIMAIIEGLPVDLPTVNLNERKPVPLPADSGEVTRIDLFLNQYCVTAPDLSVPIKAVYASYVEYCDQGTDIETETEFTEYIDNYCSVSVVKVNRPAGVFARIALRPTAYAVIMGQVTGVDVS